MSSTVSLPRAFSDLTDVAEVWALEGMAAQNQVRLRHSIEEIDEFYQRMLKRMNSIMSYLQELPTTSSLPEPDLNLYNLACAYIEVAPAAELFRDADVPDGFPVERFRILK